MRVLAATQGVKACIKRRIALTSIYVFAKIISGKQRLLNTFMTADELIAHGNHQREINQPEQALSYYAQAIAVDRNSIHAFNNYGNVLRELGDPLGAVCFLQRAIQLDSTHATAQFNLAVAYLLAGNYEQGWSQYEHRWNFEHLAGTKPTHSQLQWTGQDLKDKTILVVGEQGHGDNIQFARFCRDLQDRGGRVILQVNNNVGALFKNTVIDQVINFEDELPEFDYWAPIMSLPKILNLTLENLKQLQQYIQPDSAKVQTWAQHLGVKRKLRVGFCWSGRNDTWINRHKGMPIDVMLDLIRRNPNYDWFNLQMDATDEDTKKLQEVGVAEYPNIIKDFSDTAALVNHMDVVVTVDTAIAHLSGAIGRPTWVMLSNYALDWRWLLNRDSSPWYLTSRLFRQPKMGDWQSVTDKIHQYLSWFKI